MSVTTVSHCPLQQTHGLPYWLDLLTSRTDCAKRFYGSVLHWDYLDPTPFVFDEPRRNASPAVPHLDESSPLVAVYGGQPVAELLERGDRHDSEIPQSGWFPCICVDDVNLSLHLVERFGGAVVQAPIGRIGRAKVATVLDPSNAPLRLWQPARQPLGKVGPTGDDTPGPARPTWIELETNDIEAVRPFYAALFGWELSGLATLGDAEPYVLFTRNGHRVAAVTESVLPDLPGSWCPSFDVPDVDAAAADATEIGAVALSEPTDMAFGRQAILVDPIGAVFSLLGPVPEGPRAL